MRFTQILTATLCFILPMVAQATVMTQASVEMLAEKSDAVLIVACQDSRAAWTGKNGNAEKIFTHTYVKVLETLAGDIDVDDVLHIVQLGGTVGTFSMRFAGAPEFKAGERVVVFLHKRTNKAQQQIQDHWFVTGLFQGKFDLLQLDGVLQVQRLNKAAGVMLVPSERGAAEVPDVDVGLQMTLEELAVRVRSTQEVAQ